MRRLFDRFEVLGYEHLERALAAGRGVILVGSHMGAYIAGLHWLFRKRLPVRALVQRPPHVSRTLLALVRPAPGPLCPVRDVLAPRPAAGGCDRALDPRPGSPARRPGALPLRRHPLARTRIPGPAGCWARNNHSWPSGPSWPYSPGHPFSMSSARTFPAVDSASSSRLSARSMPARRARPLPTISSSSKPGSPPTPLRPSPICSGPVSILPVRIVPPRADLRPEPDASQPPECGCRAWLAGPHGLIRSLTGRRPTPGKSRLSASRPDSSSFRPFRYRSRLTLRSVGS